MLIQVLFLASENGIVASHTSRMTEYNALKDRHVRKTRRSDFDSCPQAIEEPSESKPPNARTANKER